MLQCLQILQQMLLHATNPRKPHVFQLEFSINSQFPQLFYEMDRANVSGRQSQPTSKQTTLLQSRLEVN